MLIIIIVFTLVNAGVICLGMNKITELCYLIRANNAQFFYLKDGYNWTLR